MRQSVAGEANFSELLTNSMASLVCKLFQHQLSPFRQLQLLRWWAYDANGQCIYCTGRFLFGGSVI